MTPADVKLLRKARQLLRKGWTQNAPARNPYDRPVTPKSPTAFSFCAFGALQAVSSTTRQVHCMSTDLARVAGYSLVAFNDTKGREYREVDALFSRVIALGDILFPTNIHL